MNFNKENMIKWAEALESGKYEQYRGGWGQHTYDDDEVINKGKFCCLNVALMEFTGKDIGRIAADAGSNSIQVFSEYLNPIWNISSKFAHMNDDQRLTFPEIAQEIRKMVDSE